MPTKNKIILVSSCLVGLSTRYDGKQKANDDCLTCLAGAVWIPICPEQLGGLPTPREASDIIDGDGNDVLAGKAKVLTKSGIDVTTHFVKGAKQILNIALRQKIDRIFLKSGSPSCAVSEKTGVTAALLRQHGLRLEEF